MRKIIVGNTKEDLINVSQDINYEIVGREFIVENAEFESLWKSDFVNKFYKTSGILIDDYETTIIMDDKDLHILKEIIEKCPPFKFKKSLLELVVYAITRKSGIVFIF